MPKEGGLQGVVLESLAECVDALCTVHGGPEGQEVVLLHRVEGDSEAFAEASEQMAFVPELQSKPGPERLAQRALDGRPVTKNVLVSDDQEMRRPVGGGAGFAILPPDALQKALQGVAGVDFEEIRRRFAGANLDVSECVGAEGHLLPDEDVLGWHPRIEV